MDPGHRHPPDVLLAALLAVQALCLAAATWWISLDQPILERHGFRQTHTALTSYWMVREGFRLDYQTPVAGYPWSIPLEFPIYEAIVAIVSRAAGTSLTATGRTVSFAFLLASLIPAALIVRRLVIPGRVLLAFAALFLSSPLYVFWGRTFMIETAATCLMLFAVAYGLRVIGRQATWTTVALACVWTTLALLQKTTTALAIVALLALAWLGGGLAGPRRATALGWREWAKASLAWALPLAVAVAWNAYADAVKSRNAFGPLLMTANTRHWNFGFPEQRISKALWVDVVLDRGLLLNAGAGLGLFPLMSAFLWRSGARMRRLLAGALLAYLAPLLVFTNLHIVHDYYQVACTVFLIGAVAIAVGGWLPQAVPNRPVWVYALMVLVVANHVQFYRHGYPSIRRRVGPEARRTLDIAKELDRTVPASAPILAYGFEWSSEVAFYSGRKSFTVDPMFPRALETLAAPETFLGGAPPGAVVSCPREGAPSPAEVDRLLAQRERYARREIHDCIILLRRPPP